MARQRYTEKELRNERLYQVYLEVMSEYDAEIKSQLTRTFICEKIKERGPFFISIQTILKELNRMLKDKNLLFYQIPRQEIGCS